MCVWKLEEQGLGGFWAAFVNEGGSVDGLGTSEGQRKSANALGAKISFGKVHIFGNRGRSTGGLGTQNISLPHEKAILIAPVGTTEGALVHWKQKY